VNKADLFEDLRGIDLNAIEERYGGIVLEIETLDAQRQDLFVQKKLHSDVIKYAVNKLENPPAENDVKSDELLKTAILQKKEFDQLLQERDVLVVRLAVPRHRLVQAMGDAYQRLTTRSHHADSASLASEMELFSRFFEMQAMLEVYQEHSTMLSEINTLRKSLLENVKTINREDRKYVQLLTKNSEVSRARRREAGRLKAYLESRNRASGKDIPEPKEDFAQRLAAGEALTLEEFSAMLEHGGLTELDLDQDIKREKKQRTSNGRRRTQAKRGDVSTSRHRRS
jgi:hypothetical protein